MALTVSITLLFLATTTSADLNFTPTACDRCIEEKMIGSQPACANLPTSIDLIKFNEDFLTPQHRKCYCSIPSDKARYMSCNAIDKCSDRT
ncbi:hypothetical protein BGW39_005316 [Mortierella sp. 14UC]|nr:hypothetical protein BGW39_005316 [Mortierella sp. 14UC]